MIDRNNYEIYLVDYLDGTLPEREKAELKALLLLRPEWNNLLEDQSEIKLKAPSVSYPKKELLKKSAEQECPDYYAIAKAENVLSALEGRQLGKAKESAAFNARTGIYRKLKIKPDYSIRYQKKDALYRKPVPRLSLWLPRIAALLVLFIASGLFIRQTVIQSRVNVLVTANFQKISPVETIRIEETPLLPTHTTTFILKQKRALSQHPIRENIEPASVPSSLIATVKAEEATSLHPVSVPSPYTPEIVLNESAKEWKSSTTNFESRDIFTSVIHAGKNLAERIKKENIH